MSSSLRIDVVISGWDPTKQDLDPLFTPIRMEGYMSGDAWRDPDCIGAFVASLFRNELAKRVSGLNAFDTQKEET
jgi:hypothetical protein